ncbi:MAG: hypothetical protein ABIR96_01755 [Bdellovibrionota bacterium]
MSALASKKFAIVGCNVSARMALTALEKKHPEASIKWLLAAKDVSPDEQADVGICLPEQIVSSLFGTEAPEKCDLEWHIHFNHHEHERLEDFASAQPRRSSSSKIPLALRRKIQSLGIWNDLTPRPWTAEDGVSWNWVNENPVSVSERKSTRWALFPRKALLEDSKLDTRYRVLGVEDGTEKDATKIIYSAPFGSESFDALLWTSHNSRPRIENQANFELKPLTRTPVGRWRTWTASVPLKSVAFLPSLSLWLDSGEAGKYFLAHGLFKSGALHRVFRLSTGKDPTRCLLQFETLELFAEPLKTQDKSRPDTILWDFCPFLKTFPAIWSENNLDENMIYSDPFPVLHHYSHGIEFWSGGAFSNISRLLEMSALWPNLNVSASRG